MGTSQKLMELVTWTEVNVLQPLTALQEENKAVSKEYLDKGELQLRILQRAELFTQDCYKRLVSVMAAQGLVSPLVTEDAATGTSSSSSSSSSLDAVTHDSRTRSSSNASTTSNTNLDSPTLASPSSTTSASSVSSTSSSAVESDELNGDQDALSKDVWLADMRYRISVDRLYTVQGITMRELGDVFRKFKETEARRRATIKALMDEFMLQRSQHWQQLPSLVNTGRAKLNPPTPQQKQGGRGGQKAAAAAAGTGAAVGGVVVDEETSLSVQRLLKEKAQYFAEAFNKDAVYLATNQVEASSGAPPSMSQGQVITVSAPDHVEVSDLSALQHLTKPLDSSLFIKGGIFMRKLSGVIERWRRCMILLSGNGYIHIYDIFDNEEVIPSDDLHGAFNIMVQKKLGGVSELSASLDGKDLMLESAFFVPSHSINLSLSVIEGRPPKDGKGSFVLEVTETVRHVSIAAKIKGGFKSHSERHFQFRPVEKKVAGGGLSIFKSLTQKNKDISVEAENQKSDEETMVDWTVLLKKKVKQLRPTPPPVHVATIEEGTETEGSAAGGDDRASETAATVGSDDGHHQDEEHENDAAHDEDKADTADEDADLA